MASKVAIVTGASSGIGAQIAIQLSARGYVVFLAARRLAKLAEVAELCNAAGGQATAVRTDVADRSQVESLVARAVDEFGRVDVMVNNAGYGVTGRVADITDHQMRRIFDVNFFALWYGCQAVAPVMIAQRSGHIFNVSSVIGKRGTPFNGAYCATKFAVCGLSDSMRIELAEYNVKVTTVCPGLTDTPFFDAVDRDVDRRESRGDKSSFKAVRTMQPAAHVARKIVAAVGKNKPEMVFTPGGKFLALMSALSPRFVDYMMKIYLRNLLRSKNRTGTRD